MSSLAQKMPPHGSSVDRLLDSEGRGTIVSTMPMKPEELAEKALQLPTQSRAELADLLVESLDAAELSQIDHAWLTEAKRRRDEVRSGTVKTISADDVFREVRESLKR